MDKNAEKAASMLGLKQDEVEQYREMKPILKLSHIDSIAVEVISPQPYTIKFKDKKTNEEKEFKALDVQLVGDTFGYAMPLSSKTLRLGLSAILRKHNFNLEGVKLSIKRSVIEFEKWGENNCYTVQEITD